MAVELKRSDICNYILYVIQGDNNSRVAIDAIDTNIASDVWIQDLNRLPHPLPSWLDGAPILVNKRTNDIHRGTDCLETIRRISETSLGTYTPQSQLSHNPGIMYADSEHAVGLSCQKITFDKPKIIINRDGATKETVQEYMKTRRMQEADMRNMMQQQTMDMVEIP